MIDVGIYHVGMNADEVAIARELKDKLSRAELLKYASKLISYIHDGTFENQVKFRYFGQLEGEELSSVLESKDGEELYSKTNQYFVPEESVKLELEEMIVVHVFSIL